MVGVHTGRYNVRPKKRLLVFISLARAAIPSFPVISGGQSISNYSHHLIPSVSQPYPMMSASLHPTSLTFAASVAPQLITSLSSNSPPLFYSQASAMHPSPVVALSHPGLILSPACDPFPQALVQRVRSEQDSSWKCETSWQILLLY